MAHTAKHLVLTLAAAALLSAPFADAAKFGGGKSNGMQRSTPSKANRITAPQRSKRRRPTTQGRPGWRAAAFVWRGRRHRRGGRRKSQRGGRLYAGLGHERQQPRPATSAAGASANQASGSPMPAQQAQAMTGAAPAAPTPAGGGMPWGTLLLLAALLGGGAWWMMRRKSAPALGSGARRTARVTT